ncbi:MAG: glycosyltransferase family 2 protein [Patescibacteria group bacterium]|nr:glycosyltransferase family 2 protein [Patescibacteria group bacterium]
MNKKDLSIVILNYNTKALTLDCLRSLDKVRNELNFEIIVCDNGSTDGSVNAIRLKYPKVKIIENRANIGFAKGNNAARNYVRGKYVLFLNSDTLVYKNTLRKCFEYMQGHKEVGALTCKVILPSGELDKDCRRSFITPTIALIHLYLKLDRLFPRSKLFGKYWYGYMPEEVTHEIDALQGAFFFTRKSILDKVNWFDEDYFLDAEDIDLSWKIKNLGWKNVYYPEVCIMHLKGATKGKNRLLKNKIPFRDRLKYVLSGVNSMEIFYRKRLWNEYPPIVNYLVILGIYLLKFYRISKLYVFG